MPSSSFINSSQSKSKHQHPPLACSSGHFFNHRTACVPLSFAALGSELFDLLRAWSVRYIELSRSPVTLLLVSSTGQRAARKSQKLFLRPSSATVAGSFSSRNDPMATSSAPKMAARSLLDLTLSLVVERIFSKLSLTGFKRNQIIASLSLALWSLSSPMRRSSSNLRSALTLRSSRCRVA